VTNSRGIEVVKSILPAMVFWRRLTVRRVRSAVGGQLWTQSGNSAFTLARAFHIGECEMIGEKLGGIAVHIEARIGALAALDEVLVSRTVSDNVAGSGLRFEERGAHSL
jgi:hypothetical protein